MMTSEVALANTINTDLADIDEDAIPVLSETVEPDDYIDMELGSNIDLAMDDYEFMARATITSPPEFVHIPKNPGESLTSVSSATLEAPSDSDNRGSPAALAGEQPEPVNTAISTLDDHSPEPSGLQESSASSGTSLPKFITAAHASVALLNNPQQAAAPESEVHEDQTIEIDPAITLDVESFHALPKSGQNSAAPPARSQKKENPFLPQHILDRLHGSSRNLVEEIAQSSAALEACTALLRTRAVTDRLLSSATRLAAEDKSLVRKQKLVDELVDDYLPLIAAELRRRLHKMLDE